MANLSFRRPLVFWLSCLALFAGLVLWDAMQLSQWEEKQYQEIVAAQPRKVRKTKLKEKSELTKQSRWEVQKKIWTSDGPNRRVIQLDAKRSEVGMFAQKHSFQLVETFYNVRGIIQQELYYKASDNQEFLYGDANVLHLRGKKEEASQIPLSELIPMQRFRYFEAEKAIYDFHTQSLVALDVKFWTFIAENHDVYENPFVLNPLAIGKASSMTMTDNANESALQFYADNLKLDILNERGLW